MEKETQTPQLPQTAVKAVLSDFKCVCWNWWK
jgi:hypothetical protein